MHYYASKTHHRQRCENVSLVSEDHFSSLFKPFFYLFLLSVVADCATWAADMSILFRIFTTHESQIGFNIFIRLAIDLPPNHNTWKKQCQSTDELVRASISLDCPNSTEILFSYFVHCDRTENKTWIKSSKACLQQTQHSNGKHLPPQEIRSPTSSAIDAFDRCTWTFSQRRKNAGNNDREK